MITLSGDVKTFLNSLSWGNGVGADRIMRKKRKNVSFKICLIESWSIK
jgi:hypothetical protein